MKKRILAVMMCVAMTAVMTAGCAGKKEEAAGQSSDKTEALTEENVKGSMGSLLKSVLPDCLDHSATTMKTERR